ncbi:hypothetical protein GF386_02180 [Candidatus Pacearchaeota archaeon]|nr:hypothetical protein [Candidatus Pacearchaeota archaeon]MBD3282976.1 hypothetical protein [Candidatus Pacearchaeota archaeon]
MKRVIPKNPRLLKEIKEKTGCRNKEISNGKACRKAEKLYKIKGGKYKRIKTIKDLLLL